jgi:hypothetical protein
LPGTNTLAYLASSYAMKERSFIRLTPGRQLAVVDAGNGKGIFPDGKFSEKVWVEGKSVGGGSPVAVGPIFRLK